MRRLVRVFALFVVIAVVSGPAEGSLIPVSSDATVVGGMFADTNFGDDTSAVACCLAATGVRCSARTASTCCSPCRRSRLAPSSRRQRSGASTLTTGTHLTIEPTRSISPR